MERVLDQLDLRVGIASDDDLDDVETKENLRIIEHSQPGKAAARDPSAFRLIDRRDRAAERFAAPRFHFYEHKRVVVARDDVDLAAAAPVKVTVENFVAVLAQKFPRQFLAECAAAQVRRLR